MSVISVYPRIVTKEPLDIGDMFPAKIYRQSARFGAFAKLTVAKKVKKNSKNKNKNNEEEQK